MNSLRLAAIRFAKAWSWRWTIGSLFVCIAIAGVLVHYWKPKSPEQAGAPDSQPAESDEPIRPIVARTDLNPGKIALGRKLFADPRLSHNDTVSCATCHDLKTGGTDRKARSIGINGPVGVINAPTVFNSGLNFSQFWDGRADTLEKQMDEPVQFKAEMGSTWPEVIRKLKTSPEYVQAFRQIYGDGMQSAHIEDAVAEFERSLTPPNSRFDRYLRG